jgi:nucleoside-diphosphate-sugar epimerase
MRIFVAGAVGAVGRPLIPMLVRAGHDVTGTTRSPERAAWLRSVGATAAILDALDENAVHAAVSEARPEVVIHQLTDLSLGFEQEELAKTARLREIGTRHLVASALAARSRRIVAQSGAWLYADGPLPHIESDPLRTPRDPPADPTLRGILELERQLAAIQGLEVIILRYGLFYGPGTAWEAEAENAPTPSVSVEAAARAAFLAVDHGPPGIYNVVSDDDAVSNRRARELLGWTP